jgi:acyl-coenzyme A synthetase/AMP-(fatty) acid ligase
LDISLRHTGETPPKAVVVLRDDHDAGERQLIDWTRAKLGAVKRVTSVDFVDELPNTPLGKVLRRVVRDCFRAVANGVHGT